MKDLDLIAMDVQRRAVSGSDDFLEHSDSAVCFAAGDDTCDVERGHLHSAGQSEGSRGRHHRRPKTQSKIAMGSKMVESMPPTSSEYKASMAFR